MQAGQAKQRDSSDRNPYSSLKQTAALQRTTQKMRKLLSNQFTTPVKQTTTQTASTLSKDPLRLQLANALQMLQSEILKNKDL